MTPVSKTLFERCSGYSFVRVSVHLDQFRRDDAHGAVVGRKRLVEPGDYAAYRRRLIHQMHAVAGICEIKRRLLSGDAGPNNQDRASAATSLLV